MIALHVHLSCDGCETPFGEPEILLHPTFRRMIEGTRDRAQRKGWRNYRLINPGPAGDFCPSCQRKQAAAKPKKGAAK